MEKNQKSFGMELYMSDLEELFSLECGGLSGLPRVGVELADRNTKERVCYLASSAKVDSEQDELAIEVEVDNLLYFVQSSCKIQ